MKKRLLVVDDVPEMSEFVRLVASDLGYDVLVRVHAKDFMRDFDSFDPTIVVLDIVIPDIDGIELVRWLHDHRCRAKVFVSSASKALYADVAQKIGAAGGLEILAIHKPYRIDELRAVLL